MGKRIIISSEDNNGEYVINSQKFDLTMVCDVGDDIEKRIVFHGINCDPTNFKTICDYYEEKYINNR